MLMLIIKIIKKGPLIGPSLLIHFANHDFHLKILSYCFCVISFSQGKLIMAKLLCNKMPSA